MKRVTTIEVHEHIGASREAIYELVTDVTRMGEWSPECFRAEWLDGTGEAAVGAHFRGWNRHGFLRWSTKPRIVTADHGREFAFIAPDVRGRDNARWTYHFEDATPGGTDVTERFELLQDAGSLISLVYRCFMGVTDRKADLQANMRNTLAALKEAAESVEPRRA